MNELIVKQSYDVHAAVRAKIVEIFIKHTKYSADDIAPDADFESDLGVDSVTLASILADVYKAYNLGTHVHDGKLATLEQVVDHVRERVSDEGGAPPVSVAAPSGDAAPSADAALRLVVEMFKRHTGYGEGQLSPDADIEGDLGVDSVTLASIIDDTAKALGLKAADLPARLQTIAELAAHVRPHLASAPRAEARTPARQEPPAAQGGVNSRDGADMQAPAELWSLLARRIEGDRAAGAQEKDELHRLSFSTIGLDQRQLDSLRETIRRQYEAPETIRLSDCDTPEKLLLYVKAAEGHRLETLGASARRLQDAPESYPAPDDDKRTMKDFVSIPNRDLFHKTREFRTFYRKKQQEQLYWYGMPLESRCENRAVIYDEITGKHREYLMFASNNYLGLANHPRVVEAIADAARKYGATNTGCRLIGGSNILHKELEHRLARLKGRDACIVYPSGYSANLGCISALAGVNDLVFTDTLNHMSIQDGVRLSGASRKIYQHTMDSLEATLAKYADHPGGKLIVTDGVFSMHGDIVDLPRLVELAKRYGARVLVDDAHSTGVLGKTGSGTTEHFGMKGAVDIELGTMSKTLAGVGGFVVADEDVVEYLRFYSNSYVFAATIPAPVAAGLIASIDIMETEPQRLAKLWSNIHRLRGHLLAAGFNLEKSESAIIPVVVGDDRKTLEFGRATRARGMFCQTVVYPGVSVGDARLRISVTSEHTDEDLDLAADILVSAAKEVGVPVVA